MSAFSNFEIARKSASDFVAEKIKTLIFAGNYAPGEELIEQEFADLLNVSRQTIREALQKIAGEGLIVLETYKRPRIKNLTIEDAEDVFMIREFIELQALEHAVNAPDPTLQTIQSLAQQLNEAGQNRLSEKFIDIDTEFHFAIVSTLNSHRISNFYSSILGEVKLLMSMADKEMYSYESMANAHLNLAIALSSRDLDQVQHLMRQHLELAKADAIKRINTYAAKTQQPTKAANQ